MTLDLFVLYFPHLLYSTLYTGNGLVTVSYTILHKSPFCPLYEVVLFSTRVDLKAYEL